MRLYNALTILSCAALITACGGSSSNDGSTPEASPAPTNSPVAAPSPTQSPQPTASQTPLPTGTPVSSPTQAPTQNEPPVSTFSFSAQQLTVIFDGSASRDPEGNRITFVWDFGDNTTQDGSRTLAIPSHTYANDGSYVVSLTVSDGALTTTSTQTVTVKRGVIVSPPSTPGPVASSPTPRPNQPTTAPTAVPTPIPSSVPTATPAPTSKPTPTPNPTPTTRPTATPTSEPTARPTATPAPTNPPTPTPTAQPNPTPAPGDDCSTREYCDDFEQAPIGAGSHGPWKSSGTVMVSDERAFSGDQSVKIVSKGGGYNRNFLSLDLANRNKLQQNQFGRMMIWIDDPGNNGGDFTFVQAEGKPKANTGAPANTNVMYRYRVDGGATNGTLMANYDTWIDADNNGQTDWLTDCWDKSTVQLPRKEWSCVEWQFDAKQNELRYWLNGKAIDELTVQGSGEGCVGPQTQMSTWYGPQRFETLHLGIEQYHGGVPVRTAYIDDVALDNRYVGCPSNPGTGGSGNGGSTGGGNTGGGNTGGGNTGGGQNTGNTGAGTLFSMDFENENVNAVPNGWNSFVSYQANNNNNRPQANNFALVGDSRARSGSKALHVKSNGQPAQIVKRLPDNIDTLHVRAWVYSSRVLGSDSNDNHEHILGVKAYEGGDSSSSFSANKEVRVGQGKGHLGFNVVPNSDAISPTMDKWYKGPTTPANEWYCVETEMQVNSKTGGYDSLIMKLNGNEVNAVRSKDDWHVNSVGSNWLSDKLGYVMFGWHSFSNHAAELWIDDIVVSTQPIGCN